jgi:hypothetical protein
MTEDAYAMFWQAIRGGMMSGEAELLIGADGEQAVVIAGVGATVLVKQSLGIEALVVDGNIPRDAQ